MIKIKSPTVLPKLVLPKRTITAGKVTAQTTIEHRKTGERPVERTKTETLDQADHGPNIGVSGLSLGLTIPGPQGSYMTARCDVSCYLPHGPNDVDAQAAINRASAIVQETLAKEAEEVQAFFNQ